MKARPILYSAPMIRALLAGRKTQTRRIIKPQPYKVEAGFPFFLPDADETGCSFTPIPCPYGRPGDLLWAREAFADTTPFAYRADFPGNPTGMGWRPGIHMPRNANRITQQIISIRVERLQDISAEDCIAEGLSTRLREHDAGCDLRQQYAALWDAINSGDPANSWAANPWVWAIEAETHLCNIDDFLARGAA